MTGYDSEFLSTSVPLPVVGNINGDELKYMHFSVVMNKNRRLAFLSAFNIKYPFNIGRDGDFHLDARLPDSQQADNRFYRRNPWDRGHLAARQFVDWGPDAEGLQADVDSFSYTNIVPQHQNMHGSGREWNQMEDRLMKIAQEAYQQKMSAFAGPIFRDNDIEQRADGSNETLMIPQAYWCIGVWRVMHRDTVRLRSVGYIVDNYRIDPDTNEIDYNPTVELTSEYNQVSIPTIEALTGTNFGNTIRNADVARNRVWY